MAHLYWVHETVALLEPIEFILLLSLPSCRRLGSHIFPWSRRQEKGQEEEKEEGVGIRCLLCATACTRPSGHPEWIAPRRLVHCGNVKIWNQLPVSYRVDRTITRLIDAWSTCIHLHRQATARPRTRLKGLVFGTPKRKATWPGRRVPCASESAT